MHRTISGAVTDFAVYLITREDPIILGGNHDATKLVDLIDAWAALRGLDSTQANIMTWEDCLKSEDPKPELKVRYF